MQRLLLQILSLTCLFALSACGFYHAKEESAQEERIRLRQISEAKLSYADVNRFVFQTSCVECHNSTVHKAGVALDTYESILENLETVKIAVLEEQTMPPDGSLATSQMSLLERWIARGAPVEAPVETATPTPTPVPVPTPAATPTPEPTFEELESAVIKKFQ